MTPPRHHHPPPLPPPVPQTDPMILLVYHLKVTRKSLRINLTAVLKKAMQIAMQAAAQITSKHPATPSPEGQERRVKISPSQNHAKARIRNISKP
jgi:hypothetical protein